MSVIVIIKKKLSTHHSTLTTNNSPLTTNNSPLTMDILDLRRQLIKRKDEICNLIEYNNALLRYMEHEKNQYKKRIFRSRDALEAKCYRIQCLRKTIVALNEYDNLLSKRILETVENNNNFRTTES